MRRGAFAARVRRALGAGVAAVALAIAVGAICGVALAISEHPTYRAEAEVTIAATDAPVISPASLAGLARSDRVAVAAAGRLGGDESGADILSDVEINEVDEGISISASSTLQAFAPAVADAFAESTTDLANRRERRRLQRIIDTLTERSASAEPGSEEAVAAAERLVDTEERLAAEGAVSIRRPAEFPTEAASSRSALAWGGGGALIGLLVAALLLAGRALVGGSGRPEPEGRELEGEVKRDLGGGTETPSPAEGLAAQVEGGATAEEDGGTEGDRDDGDADPPTDEFDWEPGDHADRDRLLDEQQPNVAMPAPELAIPESEVPTLAAAPLGLDASRLLSEAREMAEVDGSLVIGVGGAEAGEKGGQLVAALAAEAASGGDQGLAVDCLIGAPGLAGLLGIAVEPGLADYLRGEAAPPEVLRPFPAGFEVDDGGGVVVALPSGRGESAEREGLLGSARFANLLVSTGEIYDVIVLALPATDGSDVVATCLSYCDVAVMVSDGQGPEAEAWRLAVGPTPLVRVTIGPLAD